MFIIITGPTGVGKSEIAVDLALKINGEIISADSMQVYKEMDIGTYKIKKEEMKGIKHYLIDVVEPDKNFTVADFKKMAEKYLDKIKKKKKIPIIVGGTGLYIDSIIYGLFKGKKPDPVLREKLTKIYKEKGLKTLIEMLKEKDESAFLSVDLKNPRRVIRALEIVMLNKIKFSEIKNLTEKTKYKDDYFIFVLNMERKKLYEKIEKRVDKMFEEGLIEEVNELIKKGIKPENTSMQAIGYKEIVKYFYSNNFIMDLKEKIEKAKEEVKRATRNYAKRQLTWFKRYKEAIWIDVGKNNKEKVIEIILKKIGEINEYFQK